jgi:hypothetical protein
MDEGLPIHVGSFDGFGGYVIDVSLSREKDEVIHLTIDAETFPLSREHASKLRDLLSTALIMQKQGQ